MIARRTCLRALAVLPIVGTLPVAASALSPADAPVTTQADAALILLASRVEALAVRLCRVEGRCSTLEDRVFVARRNRPPLPPEPPVDFVIEHRNTATERVMVMREPFVPSPARAEWCRIRDAAILTAPESVAIGPRAREALATVIRLGADRAKTVCDGLDRLQEGRHA